MHHKETITSSFSAQPLTKDLARKHADQLAQLADQIPLVDYSEAEIMADGKPEREYHGKWKRSLIILDGDNVVGFIMGYERDGDGTDKYPQPSIYISELAVNPDYQNQGLGRHLVAQFIKHNTEIGMEQFPDTPTNFSIQTNSADFNSHVRKLYESFGFKTRAHKQYDNRKDVVMGMTPDLSN